MFAKLTRGKWNLVILFGGLLLLPTLDRAAPNRAVTVRERSEQEAASGSSSEAKTEPTDDIMKWKLINFAIFAVGLGFMLVKSAPAFFNARSADIQKAIKEATGLKMEADLRYSEVDRKMANLSAEVEKIRAEAKVEMQREHERLLNETKQELEHIRKNIAAENDGLRLEGALKVRQHTTHLALDLAERRLRDRFTAANSDDLLGEFVNLVDRGKN